MQQLFAVITNQSTSHHSFSSWFFISAISAFFIFALKKRKRRKLSFLQRIFLRRRLLRKLFDTPIKLENVLIIAGILGLAVLIILLLGWAWFFVIAGICVLVALASGGD